MGPNSGPIKHSLDRGRRRTPFKHGRGAIWSKFPVTRVPPLVKAQIDNSLAYRSVCRGLPDRYRSFLVHKVKLRLGSTSGQSLSYCRRADSRSTSSIRRRGRVRSLWRSRPSSTTPTGPESWRPTRAIRRLSALAEKEKWGGWLVAVVAVRISRRSNSRSRTSSDTLCRSESNSSLVASGSDRTTTRRRSPPLAERESRAHLHRGAPAAQGPGPRRGVGGEVETRERRRNASDHRLPTVRAAQGSARERSLRQRREFPHVAFDQPNAERSGRSRGRSRTPRGSGFPSLRPRGGRARRRGGGPGQGSFDDRRRPAKRLQGGTDCRGTASRPRQGDPWPGRAGEARCCDRGQRATGP